MEWGEIPWLGVVVAVVANQIIGFLWYGPLWGALWRTAMGITPEAAADRSGIATAIGTGVVASLVAAIALALLMSFADPVDVETGWGIGLLAGVVVSSYIVTALAYEKSNRTVAWLGIGYQIVTLVVMGAILGAMW